jgi:hypothetical protein
MIYRLLTLIAILANVYSFAPMASFGARSSMALTMGMPSTVKAGVVTGPALIDLLNYAKEKEFAIPGVNIVGTSSINACVSSRPF